jgi:hypothetical protein
MKYQSNVDTAINVRFDQNTHETFLFFVSLCTIVCCSVGTIPTVVLGIRLYSIRCEDTLYCSTCTRLFRATFYKRDSVECTKTPDDNVVSVRLHSVMSLM